MAVVLKILLLLLILAAAALLILLFWPVRCRIDGRLLFAGESAEGYLRARASLFFGLVRAYCDYPEDPAVTVKVLFFTVFRGGSGEKTPEEETEEEGRTKTLKERIRQGLDVLRRLGGKKERLQEILESRSGERALGKGKRAAAGLLRTALPGRYYLTGSAAPGDPAAAGALMMAQAVLYPWTGDRIAVIPDFDSGEINIDLEGGTRGEFAVARVLFPVLRLYLDKDVRLTWTRIKREVLNGGES